MKSYLVGVLKIVGLLWFLHKSIMYFLAASSKLQFLASNSMFVLQQDFRRSNTFLFGQDFLRFVALYVFSYFRIFQQ